MLKRAFFALIGFALLALSLSCTDPKTTYVSENKEVHAAMRQLWKDNPESLQILKDVHAKNIYLHVVMADLPEAELAITTVTTNSAIITIDVGKINSVHDNIVPVLAHEIYHIRDAFLLMGVDVFIATAEKEKSISWEYKTLEIMAIKAEDQLRQKLLKSNPASYKGMALSRAEANRRAERFAPFIH